MGLFNWFSRRELVRVGCDLIWLHQTGKLLGVAAEVERRLDTLRDDDLLIVLAHFPATLEALRCTLNDTLAQRPVHIDDDRLLVASVAELPDRSATVALGHVRQTHVVVAERHPLRDHDLRVIDFANGLGCRCEVQFHLSLEDGLMQSAMTASTTTVLKQLGMRDNERLESRMVSRRIRNLQRYLADRARGDQPAFSDLEWVRLNLPEG